MITHQELKKLVRYEPETGHFYWRVRGPGRTLNKPIRSIHPSGYRVIRINYRQYKASRLAFFYKEGRWPIPTIDHKNRARNDDHWENLCEATRKEQQANRISIQKNNTSGHRNICGDRGGFDVRIRGIRLGWRKTLEEAIKLRDDYKALV